MGSRLFIGTGKISKLLFRHERFKILVWLFGIIAVTLAAASSYPNVYQTNEDRLGFAVTMENPAMVAMLGPGKDVEDYTIGGMFSHEMLLFTVIAVAIMNILLVGRCTRADEEDGRLEMIRSLPVGRLSYLAASIIVILTTNVLLILITGCGLVTLGVEGIDWEGSLLYGSILGGTGLVFACLTAVFAQLAETSRGTTMISLSLLIAFYLVRAIGDVSSDALSLLSPLGWAVRSDVFLSNKWWPVLLSITICMILVCSAFYLSSIRDIDSGFIPARKGNKHASGLLQNPIGLTLRLQRTNIVSWAIGLFLLSVSFGSVLGDLETYFSDMDFIQAFLEDPNSSMTDQFITLLMGIMSLISTIPAMMTVLRLKGEENKGYTENFFSRSVSRTRLMGGYLLIAIAVSFFMQCLVALGLWSVGSSVMKEGLSFSTTFGSALVYLPAMWILIGIVILLIGIFPKATGLSWLYLTFCFIVIYLGGLLDFPEWVNQLSVFEHVPKIQTEDVELVPIMTLIVSSTIITFVGFIGYNKRDMAG
ncbi:ABC transporter permease [Bacillus massilinigeriensis]|uniref:ABC transporter permease n=1 Tax=Bacillus massilionigeriensis TaxID=1805475 RepID=UPI00096AED8F|nr:ABC transporter permease [Bacillus massilionigeriensis]